jgi:hypothetical protein
VISARLSSAGSALRDREQWHDEQGSPRDDKAGHRMLGPGMDSKVSDALDGEVGGQGKECHTDEAHRAGLAFLPAAAQLPDDDGRGEELDHRVQAGSLIGTA